MKQKQKSLKYLLFVNLFSLAGYNTFAPLYALFAHSFTIAPKTISLMWGGYSLLMACFILIFGKYENRRKKGKLVVAGYFLYACGALLFLTVHDAKSLAFVLAFNAFGAGVTMPAHKTLFAKNESRGKESEQWSWLDAGSMFAAARQRPWRFIDWCFWVSWDLCSNGRHSVCSCGGRLPGTLYSGINLGD